MFTFDVNCAPFTCDAHSDVAAKILARSRWNIAQRRTGAFKIAVEGGPRGLQGGEGPQTNEGGFCGSCWTCGGGHRSDRCEIKWLRQFERSIRRLSQGGRDDLWLVHKTRATLGQVKRMRTPGPTAIPIFELPRPRDKTGGGGQPVPRATRKGRRPRKKRKIKMKTKTAVVVVKAQEQEMHRQEEESRWAAEMQAAKENERTQQEEDSRWAAAKGKEEADAAETKTKTEEAEAQRRRIGMLWQAAIDETAEALSERQDERRRGRRWSVEAILEGFFGLGTPVPASVVVYRHPSLCTGTFRRCAQGHFEDVASTKCTTGTGPVVELQQAVGQAKARMVSAIRSYAEAYGRSDSEEASDGEDTEARTRQLA